MTEFELRMGDVDTARRVYGRANRAFAIGEKEGRLMLLQMWLKFEDEYGDQASAEKVSRLMPKKVTFTEEAQADANRRWHRCWVGGVFFYNFGYDQALRGSFKLLGAARRWREKMAATNTVPLERDEMKKELEESERDGEEVEASAEREKKVCEGDSGAGISESTTSGSVRL
ncbi:unnamed protein product [Toxocara canis]|uniref:BUB1 N-terminal domain-containing protein n=1 Tax=Toxocara canis TaxID=6265 RepID=A0A183U1N8_TOXCA|nr:unnamed protein product [Toxocara canis]